MWLRIGCTTSESLVRIKIIWDKHVFPCREGQMYYKLSWPSVQYLTLMWHNTLVGLYGVLQCAAMMHLSAQLTFFSFLWSYQKHRSVSHNFRIPKYSSHLSTVKSWLQCTVKSVAKYGCKMFKPHANECWNDLSSLLVSCLWTLESPINHSRP